MSLLTRLKGRVTTDLTDLELQTRIDAITAEIASRFGAIAARTERFDGLRRYLSLAIPADTGETITVVELDLHGAGDAASETTLSADDYRVLHGGRIFERLIDGTNGRSQWAAEVAITYTPVSDQAARDEITLKVMELELHNKQIGSERYGDFQATYADVPKERERLMRTLAPKGRGGLV